MTFNKNKSTIILFKTTIIRLKTRITKIGETYDDIIVDLLDLSEKLERVEALNDGE